MKRIAIISPSDLPIPAVKGGAVETGIQQIINQNELQKQVKIDIYSFYDKNAAEKANLYQYTKFNYYHAGNIDTIFLNFAKLSNKIMHSLKIKVKIPIRYFYIKFLKKSMKEKKYDAILIKNNVDIVLPLSRVTDCKIFLQLHNDNLNSSTPYAFKIATACTKIITNSQYIKKCVLSIPNISKEKILINKNCLNEEDFQIASKKEKNDILKQYNIIPYGKIILFSGRLVPQKGIRELLKALNNIKEKDEFTLLIAGSKWFGKTTKNAFLKELENLSLELKDRVCFLGYVPHDKMRILNTIADLVIVPSIWEEPAGRVVLEAQAVGTPVIITNSGGLPEYVNHNLSSVIIEKDDNLIKNLSDAILHLLNNEQLLIKMGKEGIKYAKMYNEEHYFHEILSILDII